MRRNKAVKHRFCALKLDMCKAYDRVNPRQWHSKVSNLFGWKIISYSFHSKI
jgi:hypothetical protein